MSIVPFEVQFNWIWQPEENPKGKGTWLCETAPHDFWQTADAFPRDERPYRSDRTYEMMPRNCMTMFLQIDEIVPVSALTIPYMH